MANFDDNPFAGDSENPFAVSIWVSFASEIRTRQSVVWSWTIQFPRSTEAGRVILILGMSCRCRIHRLLQLRIMQPEDLKISIPLRTKTRLKLVERRLFISIPCFVVFTFPVYSLSIRWNSCFSGGVEATVLCRGSSETVYELFHYLRIIFELYFKRYDCCTQAYM